MPVDKLWQWFGRIGRRGVWVKAREFGMRQAVDLVVIRLEIDPTNRQNPEDTGQADNIVGGMKPRGKVESEQLGNVYGPNADSNGYFETIRGDTDKNNRKIGVLPIGLVLQKKVSYRIRSDRENFKPSPVQ